MRVRSKSFNTASRPGLLWRNRGTSLKKTKKIGPYLIQPWLVIGDTLFALEVAERIWEHQPDVTIDILCTNVQRQIVADHPKIVESSLADLHLQSSNQAKMRIIPIPKDFYEQSEHMKQKRQEYASHLPEYETVFIEDPTNFEFLFGKRQNYTHNSLQPFEIQAIVERLSPLPLPFLRDIPKYIRTRTLVDTYFDARPSWNNDRAEPIPLFLASHRIAEAEKKAARLKEQAERPDGLLLLVNADTSSPVTRPPATLLVLGIAKALHHNPGMVVGILPGYTCPEAHKQVYRGLEASYGRQIQYVEPTSWPEHLLDTTAFIDQADIFITGDTGLMHLATTKKITTEGNASRTARNSTSIITLWGGTRPGYWGYPKLTTIIGEGNPLQRQMYPGIRKYTWAHKTANYFGHIDPSDIAKTIIAVQRK
jgi:hypothetical protein